MSDTIHSPKEKYEEMLVEHQGESYQASLDELLKEDPHSQTEKDDYSITASFEPAEGMYIPQDDGSLKWTKPKDEINQHLEVIVQDRHDKRFIPYLSVSMKLYDEIHTVIVDKEIPFIWHPFVLHYGIDASLPKEGTYTPEVTIRKPLFHRHDQIRGKRYTQDVTVKLSPVHLTPGKKSTGPE